LVEEGHIHHNRLRYDLKAAAVDEMYLRLFGEDTVLLTLAGSKAITQQNAQNIAVSLCYFMNPTLAEVETYCRYSFSL